MAYPQTIGKTMSLGFAGTISRMSDNVVAPFIYASSNVGNIQFGEPVVYDPTTKGVRKMASGDTADSVIGFAVRHASQPKSDTDDGWYYAPGETVDVILRGSIMVPIEDGATATIAPRGSIYADPATGLLYGATASGRVALNNAKIANGRYDAANQVIEVTVLERAM